MGRTVTYSLLAILDFNNIRKRMSVIGMQQSVLFLHVFNFPGWPVYGGPERSNAQQHKKTPVNRKILQKHTMEKETIMQKQHL